jgi:two-component system phosphate regulon sensor histidine kinase PhoR
MGEQAMRMQRLVDDLLALSKLESPQHRLVETPVDVPQLLRQIHQDARGLSAGRHEIVVKQDADVWIVGNADELASAFGNLVSNAVRYTPEGGAVTLRWSMDAGEAVFSVTDTGEGIEPQHLSRLTERFYRVDRGRSRALGGTGLGLAIVKHVLQRHDARLDIRSTPGIGSTFSAAFPAARVVPGPITSALPAPIVQPPASRA